MNISTTSLLNILAPKLSNSIKETIENLSKDGKVNIQTALKDKTIQTVLGSLFTDIISGAKTKNSVQELLNNSKNLFDLKSLTNDLKNILNDIQNEPKLEKQASVLKEFLVNIKNLNENILKNNIANSGIFLESKIGMPQNIPNNKLFEKIFLEIKQIDQKTIETKSFDTIKNIFTNLLNQITDTQVKQDIQKITTQIQTIESTNREEIQSFLLKGLKNDIKNIETKLITNNILETIKPVLIQNNSYITNDIKAVLLQIDEIAEKSLKNDDIPKELKVTVEKLLTQIEFYQLYSYTASSNISYLPFVWDNIEEGELKFDKKENDSFSCQINLTLKNFGEIKTLLQLDNKNNLLINMAVEQNSLKERIQQNLQYLRQSISSIGLMVQGLNVFDMISNQNKSYKQKAYNSDSHIDFGVDIKV